MDPTNTTTTNSNNTNSSTITKVDKCIDFILSWVLVVAAAVMPLPALLSPSESHGNGGTTDHNLQNELEAYSKDYEVEYIR